MKTEDIRQTESPLLTKPVQPLICRLAVPTMVTMLITAFYNLADTYFAGRIHKEATAAIGVTFSLMALLQAFSFFIGQGFGNYISRLLGAGSRKRSEEMAANAVVTSLACGVLFAVLIAFFTEPLMRLLGATETILPYAAGYTRILTFGIPWIMTSFVLNNLLRFQGSAFYGMLGIGAGSVLNIVLDPVFMFVSGMGIAGAALATVLSQAVGFLLLLWMCSRRDNIRIRLKNFRPSTAPYREMVRGGLPALCRQGLTSVAALALNWCVKPYGDGVIAAFSIVSRLTGFAYSAMMGFGQGFQPVCGFNYGAGRYSRVREGYRFCVRLSAAGLAILAVVGFVFAGKLCGLFEKEDAEVVAVAVQALRFQCFGMPFAAVVVMSNMLTQTMGWAKSATVLSIARQGIFFLPLLFLAAWARELTALFLVQPLADGLSCILALVLGGRTMKLLK